MTEIWEKILAVQQSEKAERERVAAEALKEESRRQHRLDEAKTQKHLQESLVSRERLRKIATVRRIVVPMLEDIRINSPEIRKAPLSRVKVTYHHENIGNEGEVIELQWGKKLDLTPDEAKIVDKFEYTECKENFWKFRNKIDGQNYSYIALTVNSYPPSISIFRGNYMSHSYEDFLRNPDCIIPDIAKALQDPNIVRQHYFKGKGYWMQRSSGGERIPGY